MIALRPTIGVSQDAEAVTYTLPDRNVFLLPTLDPVYTEMEPGLHFVVATNAAAVLAEESQSIANDATLSQIGREQKLDPKRAAAIEAISRSARNLDVFEKSVDAMEADLVAVPRIPPTDAVTFLEDREIRDTWRAMTVEERAELMRRVLARDPGCERFALAVLRSPVPLDAMVEHLRAAWADWRRYQEPAKATEIVSSRVAIDWGRRGMLQVAAIVATRMIPGGSTRIRDYVSASNDQRVHLGSGIFGVAPLPSRKSA